MSQENATGKQPLIRPVNRQQMSWRAVDVERLIEEDHLARAIWTLVGRLNLSAFYQGIESSAEEGGRPAFDPQLLISLWVYAYTQEIGSAREVARRCEFDPAFQWLTGLEEVNYHTLADFRVEKQEELDELFTQVLAALSKEGLITLKQVMQDGTKIRAAASPRSFQWESNLQEHWDRARRCVAEMGDPRNDEGSPRVKQARARAQRERQERLAKALGELEKLREKKPGKARISVTEPEARRMKLPDGGLALGYNAQISADAAHGLIVGVAVTQEANDTGQLLPAVERIEERLQRKPEQMVADAGYTTRAAIEEMAERKVDFLGSMPREDASTGRTAPHRLPPGAFIFQPETNRYGCPEGKPLRSQGQEEAGSNRLSLRGKIQRLSTLRPEIRMLPGKSEPRPGNSAFGGERRSSSLPAEDGNRRSAGELSSAWKGRGILSCVDKEQAGPAPVSRAWPSESSNGNAMGLPHLQPAALDPPPKAPTRTNGHLKAKSKKRKSTQGPTQQASSSNPRTHSAILWSQRFLHSFTH
jgi:transposase